MRIVKSRHLLESTRHLTNNTEIHWLEENEIVFMMRGNGALEATIKTRDEEENLSFHPTVW